MLIKNKKAYFDFEILDTFETGIILTGGEIKPVYNSQVNLKGSFVSTDGKKIFAENIHISPYQPKNQPNYSPTRKRQLLLKKEEIVKIIDVLNEKGKTVIPLEMYNKGSLIKVKIGLCRGRKKYDKRELLKKRAETREIQKALKKYR